MSDLRIYIQVLRKGEFFKALKMVTAIAYKYQKINNDAPLDNDYLLQLVMFELCKTDISADDFSAINTLYNYLYHKPELMHGPLGFALTTLHGAALYAVAIKEELSNNSPALRLSQLDLHRMTIQSAKDIKNFIHNDSDFSQLITDIQYKINPAYKTVLNESLDLKQLEQRLASMNKEKKQFFEKDLESLEKELARERRIEERRQHKHQVLSHKLKKSISCYKAHLLKKLAAEGLTGKLRSSPEITPKLDKLMQRYKIIAEIDLSKLNCDNRKHIARVHSAIERCKKLAPDWRERSLLQRITDILSIGLRPLFRMFFSKEPRFTVEIEALAQDLCYTAPAA